MIKLRRILNALNNNRYLWPLKITVTVFVMYLVNQNLSKNQMPDLVNKINWPHVALAVFLGLTGLFFQARRWLIILRCKGIVINNTAAFRTILFGNLLAFITPGRAGEFFRGVGLPVHNKADTVYAVLVDKLFAGGFGLAFGMAGLALSVRTATLSAGSRMIVVCFGATVLVLGTVALVIRKYPAALSAGRHFPRFTKQALGSVLLLSILTHLALCIQTSVLLDMFGSHAMAINMCASAQAYAFMQFLPFFIANMGIREYSFGLFLGEYHSMPVQALTLGAVAFGASMGILVINMILPALAGLIWWMLEKKRMKAEG
jgi:uncharacterized membrane protein YbhN (UPF0104 family)